MKSMREVIIVFVAATLWIILGCFLITEERNIIPTDDSNGPVCPLDFKQGGTK